MISRLIRILNSRFFIAGLLLISAQAGAADASSHLVQPNRTMEELSACLLKKFVDFTKGHFQDLSGDQLEVVDPVSGESSELKLGREINGGFFGSVYAIDSLPSDILAHVAYVGPVIVKVGKIPKIFNAKKPVFFSTKSLNEEYRDYQRIQKYVPDISRSPLAPKDPAWGDHQPVVPILAKLATKKGPVLLKPLVKGKTLADYYSFDELTPEMKSGLEDILQFAKALDASVPGKFSIDINGSNLMWIEDPTLLKKFGYSRPGWILFEESRIPIRHFVELDFQTYLKSLRAYFATPPRH